MITPPDLRARGIPTLTEAEMRAALLDAERAIAPPAPDPAVTLQVARIAAESLTRFFLPAVDAERPA